MADPDFGRKYKIIFAKILNKIFYHGYCYRYFLIYFLKISWIKVTAQVH